MGGSHLNWLFVIFHIYIYLYFLGCNMILDVIFFTMKAFHLKLILWYSGYNNYSQNYFLPLEAWFSKKAKAIVYFQLILFEDTIIHLHQSICVNIRRGWIALRGNYYKARSSDAQLTNVASCQVNFTFRRRRFRSVPICKNTPTDSIRPLELLRLDTLHDYRFIIHR